MRLDARVMVMATQDGFASVAAARRGSATREASHVAVGVEYLADVGTYGFFRLGWGTVPQPADVGDRRGHEPAGVDRETGVRLYYDVAREVAPGVRLGVRVGYAARNQSVAGFTGGAGATVEF